jgi:hypothetical protein
MAMVSKVSTFITNYIQTNLSVVKIFIQSKFFSRKVSYSSLNKCVVLGNGPSLLKEMQTNLDWFITTPKISVNLFVKSEYYIQLKPEFYVINAPEHWFEGVNELGRKATVELYELLAERTTWDMTLLIPYRAKRNSEWIKYIEKNKNIRIVYYNKTPIEGFQWFCNGAYKRRLGMPRPHNVVIPALIHAINIGFKEIYLAGVDHSWLTSLRVEQDNTVTMEHAHVYGTTPTRYPIFAYIDEKRHLHDMLTKFVNTFKSYFIIKAYAENRGRTIYNITEGSFIDAFEKRKPG